MSDFNLEPRVPVSYMYNNNNNNNSNNSNWKMSCLQHQVIKFLFFSLAFSVSLTFNRNALYFFNRMMAIPYSSPCPENK